MNFKCVEVVRDVINRDGGSQSVLGANFDVFSHTPVCGEIRWKTTAGRLIALKVILIDIDRLIGETTPQLDHGINCHPPWERYAAQVKNRLGISPARFVYRLPRMKGEEKSPR